jgi:hypothetical protein
MVTKKEPYSLLSVQNKAEAERLAVGRPWSLRSIFEEAHEQIRKSGGIPQEQFWREVEQSRRAKRAQRKEAEE